MDVSLGEDGNYHVVLSKAEGHTFIWGMRAWNVIRWNLKHAMIELEDSLEYDEAVQIADDADRLMRSYGYREGA